MTLDTTVATNGMPIIGGAPYNPTCIEFLQEGAGPDWRRVPVTMMRGDPERQPPDAWRGYPAEDMLKTYHADLNTYFSVGLPVSGGSRSIAGFEKIFALVLDDVGTKVNLGQAQQLLGLGPSYVLETSPGNHQAGWWLEPISSKDWALGLVKALYEALGRRADNLRNLVGYMRLPVGVNGKARLGPGGWPVRMRLWNPGTRIKLLDWPDIETRIGRVTPISRVQRAQAASMPDPGEITQDPVLRAFELLGRVQGGIRRTTMGWGFDVDCPWKEEHTDRVHEGAVYVPVLGRFHCHHGHCQDRTMSEVRERLDELLRRDQPGTIIAALEFDEIDEQSLPKISPGWKAQWQAGKTKGSGALSNAANVMLALRTAPDLAGAFGFNEFTLEETLRRELPEVDPRTTPGVPRAWRDQDTILLQCWLQRQGLPQVTPRMVDDAVSAVMHERKFHPVRDWLVSLVWDLVPRLDTWLCQYLGTPQDPYHAHVGRWWLMTMCRRIHEPGCRADYMPILEGPQGHEKSSALRVLANPWFSDHLPEIGTKDASAYLVGRWLIEIAELDRFDRAESTQMKAFVSRTTETYRRAYARRTASEPRQCVFAGTSNHSSYLKDETGNRRYWPIATETIDLSGLAQVRDQLFAEAWHHAVVLGEPYWPDPMFEDLFMQPEQDKRLETDPWEHLVASYLRTKQRVLVHEVITAATGGGVIHLTTTNRNRVIRVLETLGWRRGARGPVGERFWYPHRASPSQNSSRL